MVHDVHGHGEDDGRVVLRRYAVQRLQVAQLRTGGTRVKTRYISTTFTPPIYLKGRGALCDDVSGLPQRPRRLLLSLGGNHLGTEIEFSDEET